MINENIKEILNEQINKEFYAAYLYLSMSAHFDKMGLFGFAKWTKIQAKEEVDHGMKIFEYLLDRDCRINLKQINVPDSDFGTPLSIFEKIYEHEKMVTSSIECITYLSQDECDMATREFINWYLREQVEEEKQTNDIITRLKLFGEDKASLFLMDNELSKRE